MADQTHHGDRTVRAGQQRGHRRPPVGRTHVRAAGPADHRREHRRAGGSIGTARAARAAPDGYTIVIGGADTFAQNQSLFEKPPYNPATDFVPIVLAVELPLVLVGRNGLPPSNLQELILYMKANQDKMQFGSSGVGGATHLACAQVMRAAGVTLAHVPYRSAAAGIQA